MEAGSHLPVCSMMPVRPICQTCQGLLNSIFPTIFPMKRLYWILYTQNYLGSRLDEEEEKKVKEIDDDMLYYDLKILLRGVSEEAPPIMKTHFSYEVLPFEVVEKRYLELFERYYREL